MMVDRTDTEGCHGGEIGASVERADFRQEAGYQSKIVQRLQQPYNKFQNDAWNKDNTLKITRKELAAL